MDEPVVMAGACQLAPPSPPLRHATTTPHPVAHHHDHHVPPVCMKACPRPRAHPWTTRCWPDKDSSGSMSAHHWTSTDKPVVMVGAYQLTPPLLPPQLVPPPPPLRLTLLPPPLQHATTTPHSIACHHDHRVPPARTKTCTSLGTPLDHWMLAR